MRFTRGRLAVVFTLVVAASACGSDQAPDSAAAPASTAVQTTRTLPAPSTTVAPVTRPTTTLPPGTVEIVLRFERRTTDPATEGFAAVAQSILTDGRGWESAGFHFRFAPDAPYAVVLDEPAGVDAACLPYDTQGQYSCQIGPVVALNADRWRSATSSWPGSLEDYRAMLVNHEVGHLLGLHHPAVRCPAPGQAAPVMAQQSIGLEGCAPNPWPLPWEIACAARHEEPVAPGYDADAAPLCGPEDG